MNTPNDQQQPPNLVNIMTTGDARRLLLEVILDVRSRSIEVARAEMIFKGVDSLTKLTQVEINAAKLAAHLENKAHNFGKVVQMGRRILGDDSGHGA
jgi:hypothetical protein